MGRVNKKRLELFRSQSFWLWLLTAFSLAFLAIFVIYVVLVALNQAIYFNGYAADGPFQLYNPLRRMAAGQVPGRNFQFFHGIGVVLLHYIPFKLLGSNLFASETSRWLVSPFLFLASGFLFFLAAFKSWRKAIIALAIFTVLSMRYLNFIWPENSLNGVRTTFTMLAAAALLWDSTRQITIYRYRVSVKRCAVLLALALAFICGTEQGLAAIVAYALILLWPAFKAIWAYITTPQLRSKRKIKETSKAVLIPTALSTIRDVGAILALILLLMTIVTHGHALHALHYALIDIPQDQGWYFGAAPNSFITWNDILPNMLNKGMIGAYVVIVLSAGAYFVGRRWKLFPKTAHVTFVYLWLYGIVVFAGAALFGYFSPLDQLNPLMRGAGLITTLVLMLLVFKLVLNIPTFVTTRKQKILNGRQRFHIAAWLVGMAALLLGGIYYIRQYYIDTAAGYDVRTTLRTANEARHKPDYFIAGPGWKQSINAFAPYVKPGTTVWSTYSSLYESNASIFNPSKGEFDYIIHALGEQNRQAYVQQFTTEKPEYAITLRPTYFLYEEWLWSKVPQFYEQLITHYRIIVENDSQYLWKYSPRANVSTSSWKSVLPINGGTFKLPGNTTSNMQLLEVKFNYAAGAPITNLDRYELAPVGTGLQYPMTLPPHEHSWTLLVPVMPGQTEPQLKESVYGLLNGHLRVSSFSYRYLDVSEQTSWPFIENYCMANGAQMKRIPICSNTPVFAQPLGNVPD
jgi:hypothetical protein